MRDSQINKNRYDMRRVKSLFGGLAFWPRAANDSLLAWSAAAAAAVVACKSGIN
jgi:hypothetical protein